MSRPETPCPGCAYDLRGLWCPEGATCPECGAHWTEQAIHDARFRFHAAPLARLLMCAGIVSLLPRLTIPRYQPFLELASIRGPILLSFLVIFGPWIVPLLYLGVCRMARLQEPGQRALATVCVVLLIPSLGVMLPAIGRA